MALLRPELCFGHLNVVVGARMDERLEVTLHNQTRYNESLILSGGIGLGRGKT